MAKTRYATPEQETRYRELPFAALRAPDTGRYLVQDFTLVELPSAATLTALRPGGPGARGARPG